MKQIILFAFLFFSLLISQAQTSIAPQEFYLEEFKWRITIPANFENVTPEDWKKEQDKGAKAMEETLGEEVENNTKTIFAFKNGLANVMECNVQPFDEVIDGDYGASCIALGDIMYQTFLDQMPGIKIDSSYSVKTIDELEFKQFSVTIINPNGIVFKVYMFSRLFGKQEFSLNIFYTEESMGALMMKAWMESVFE